MGQKKKIKVAVAGFGPFGGRAENASWVAAHSLSRREDVVLCVQVPVIWGAPRKVAETLCMKFRPDMIIVFGEADYGRFVIETLAHNRHGLDKKDVLNEPPPGEEIIPGAPAELASGNDNEALARVLRNKGFPTGLSNDAGSYLCEEIFYWIETLCRKHDFLQKVVFVHVPWLGRELDGPMPGRKCSQEILASFAETLLDILIDE